MKSKLFTSTLTFSVLTFLQPAVSFLLLPLYLTYLTVEEYGIYNLINTYTYLIGGIAALRIFASIHTYYYDYRYSKKRLNDFFGSLLGFSIIAAVIFLGILIYVGQDLFQLIFKNEINFYPYGLIGAVSGISISLYQPYLTFMRNEQKIRNFAWIVLLLVALTAFFQIILIVWMDMNVEGALLGRAIASVLVGILCLMLTKGIITFKLKKVYIFRALQFSIPLIPFTLIAWISTFIDRYFIEQFSSLETLGLFTFISTICLLVIMANDGLMGGIQPFLFDLYSKKIDSKEKTNKINIGYLHLLLIISSSLILLFGTMKWWMADSEYVQVVPYIAPGVSIYYLYSYYSLFRLNLLYLKKSLLLSVISIIYALILIALMFILVPKFLIWGALVSNFAGIIVLILLTYWASVKSGNTMNLSWKGILLPVLLCLLMTCSSILPLYFGWFSFEVGAIGQFLIIFLIVVIVNKKDIKEMKQLAKALSERLPFLIK